MAYKKDTKLFVTFSAILFLIFTLIGILPVFNASNRIYPVKPKAQNYSILIDTTDKNIYLLNNGKLIKKYNCATGANGTPSPLGSFKINKKAHWGEGFGGYWMGINCPWGNYGIHGTLFPESIGYAASHGCFRMYNEDCEELYKTVPVGTPVVVTGGAYGAFGGGFRDLGPGMYGSDLQCVQLKLKSLGYYSGSCSGLYETYGFRQAIHKFQKDNDLPVSDYITQKMYNALGFILMD